MRRNFIARKVFFFISLGLFFLVLFLNHAESHGVGDDPKTSSLVDSSLEISSPGDSAATGKPASRGKHRSAKAPARPHIGMIWIKTTNKREYIYDGAQWAPHDATVDSFYETQLTVGVQSLTQDEVCLDGDPNCTPTGAHGGPGTTPAGHYGFYCTVCHKVGGRLVFDRNGPAYAAGKPAPTFDATAKTCSNVACHGVPSGTFSYWFPDGTGEPVLNTVSYGGTNVPTPSWYSTGAAGCEACHPNPPRNGSSGSNVWHSGYHAGLPTSASNQCQFCHPDATGANGIGTAITNPAQHGDGIVQVQVTFRSSCFSCH